MDAKTKTCLDKYPLLNDMFVKVTADEQVERMLVTLKKSTLQIFLDENNDSSAVEIITFAKKCTVDQLALTSKVGIKQSAETYDRIYEIAKSPEGKSTLVNINTS